MQTVEEVNEHFERLASEFFKETGHMAPGKDAPPGMETLDTRERHLLWDMWINRKGVIALISEKQSRIDTLEARLKEVGEVAVEFREMVQFSELSLIQNRARVKAYLVRLHAIATGKEDGE